MSYNLHTRNDCIVQVKAHVNAVLTDEEDEELKKELKLTAEASAER